MKVTNRIEIPKVCPEKNHWENVLAMGVCNGCNLSVPLANENTHKWNGKAWVMVPKANSTAV